MKRSMSVLAAILIGFFWVSLGELSPLSASWNEAFAFSVEEERKLGEEVAKEIQNQMEMIEAPSIQGYVGALGKRLASNADRSQFPIHFSVLKEAEPNAFAIPAGRIYVTSGLIRFVENEGELAGVMCHEIAHVVRRHVAQRIEESKRLNIATLAGVLAGVLLGGSEGGAIMTGSMALSESQKLKYTRANESEADRLGLAYMTRSGYDGREMISFLRKLTQMPTYNAAFPSYLSTHPGVPERISYLETLMGGLSDSTRATKSEDALKHIHLRLFIVAKGPLESIKHFSGLLEMRPDDGDALFGRALATMEMGRVKESIEDLKRAHVVKPRDPQILKVLGLAFIRVGRVDEGLRALERSLSLSPGDAETLFYLGQGYQTLNRLNLAIDSYLKARESYPDLPGLDRSLGSAYKERGEMSRSHFYYGLYFKRRGEVKYARFHLEKALELSGQDPERQAEVMRELEELKR